MNTNSRVEDILKGHKKRIAELQWLVAAMATSLIITFGVIGFLMMTLHQSRSNERALSSMVYQLGKQGTITTP